MTTPAKTVRVTTVTVSAIYAGALYVAGLRLNQDVKHVLAYLPTLGGFAVVGFDKWFWKASILRRVLPRPRVDGLWKTTLKPSPDSHIPAGGNRGPIPAYVVIEQSYWSIHVCLFTGESKSSSKAASFTQSPDSQQQTLMFTYTNQPKQEHLARSPRHIGACELDIAKAAPTSMSGLYFTERLTRGDMELSLVDRSIRHASFQEADQHTQKTSP